MILSLKLYCLGPFQLEANGQAITLPTRKTLALLVYLALHPKAHAREQLCTLFWGDFADHEAQRSLRTALSALRKALGATCLLADRELVQFNPAYTIWVDALIFRTQAQRFLAQPLIDPALLDLALHRGDLLAGFYDDWILREREALRLLYLQGLLKLAQHWRTQGDYTQTINVAQQIIALDPAEEVAHQHLLFCYTAAGDRKAAHQQYEICVRALHDELDASPSPETTALYRRSQQTLHKPHSAAFLTNLPLPLASFIGRVHEITRLEALLLGDNIASKRQSARLVTVTGPGGCGKTRLAIQVARKLLDVYPDGIWWVELAALRDETQVAQAVAKVLDVQQGVQPSLTDVLINNLRTKRALLVLDNCEHLVSGCAELADRLLTHCPDLQILATSRQALGITGEVSWLVPSLTLPNVRQNSPIEMFQFEGIQLFVERASAVQRDFTLSPENIPAILQICRQLDGIPLAIELAAARVKSMTVEQLAIRLTSVIGARFELLTDGSRTVLPRQQTLRATMAWSYALLSEQEQRLLQQCALFTGGWFLEAAEATGADSGAQPVASILARLVDKSLVLAEPQCEVVRYQMLETVRQYAFEQLEKSGDVTAARDGHLVYFLQLAEQAEPEFRGAGQLTWLRRLDADYENLRAALTWGLKHEPIVIARLMDGGTLATDLFLYWRIHGDWTEGSYWMQTVARQCAKYTYLVAADRLHHIIILRAKASWGAGIVAWHQEKLDEASQLLDQSAELWRADIQQIGLFRTQLYQAQLISQQEDLKTAYKLWHECLINLHKAHDTWYIAETIFFMGYAERRAGNFDIATSYYKESIALLQELGERWLFSGAISHLGIIALEQQDYVKAWPLIEQRLLLGREFGLKYHMYTALDYLSSIAYKQGDVRLAASLLREALVLEGQAGVERFTRLAYKVGVIGLCCALDGEHERAIRLLAANTMFLSMNEVFLSRIERDDLTGDAIYQDCLTALRTKFGEVMFTLIWAEGATLTPDQAFEEALL